MPDFGDIDPFSGETSERTRFSGSVDPYAPSVANGMITPEQWAEYQRKRRRDALLGITATLGGMLGAQPLVNALGIGTTTAGALNASAGGAALPAAATEGMLPMSVAGGAGAGAGAGTGIFAGLSARDLAGLGLSAAGTIGGAMSNRPNLDPNTQTSDPNLQKLLQTMQGRLDKSEPLYDSVLAMANGLLPMQYQKGGGGMR